MSDNNKQTPALENINPAELAKVLGAASGNQDQVLALLNQISDSLKTLNTAKNQGVDPTTMMMFMLLAGGFGGGGGGFSFWGPPAGYVQVGAGCGCCGIR